MAYSVTNPPSLIAQNVGGGASLWIYKSADAEDDFDESGYITNAGDLGMKTGDAIICVDTSNGLTSMGKVTVTSGAGTLSAFTAIT